MDASNQASIDNNNSSFSSSIGHSKGWRSRFKKFAGVGAIDLLPNGAYYNLEARQYFAQKIDMDILIQELDNKLRQWQPDIVEQVRQCLVEIIELADRNALDILRSRTIEQEVLDLIDEPETW